jgi:hypothetical protein
MNFLRIPLIILLVLSGFLSYSQSNRADTIKMLCQTWKIKQIDQEPIDEELREDWREMIKYSSVEFKVDMTIIDRNGETSEKANWNLSKSSKEIKFKYKNGETRKWVIVSLSSLAFRFKEKDPESNLVVSGTLIPVKK